MKTTDSTSSDFVRRFSILPLFLSLFLIAGCGSIDIKSRWRDREVIIDGKNTEWRYMTQLEDKETSVGMLNDGEFLYLILTSSNRDVSNQITRRGITFWFDKEGGSDKKFGVRYPLGFGGFRSFQPDEKSSDAEPEMRTRGANHAEEVEILGPGKDEHHDMTLAETNGIEARFTLMNDFLVYEMKIPLADNGLHPFAIGAAAGKEIGVGAEVSTDRPAQRRPEGISEGEGRGGAEGISGRGAGMGGRGGGRRGGGGGRGGNGPSEPFKMWANVQLSAPDTTKR